MHKSEHHTGCGWIYTHGKSDEQRSMEELVIITRELHAQDTGTTATQAARDEVIKQDGTSVSGVQLQLF